MKYRVKGANISIVADEVLVAGTVGIYHAEFEFDSSWDEYDTIIGVFKNEDEEREQIIKDGKCEIPWEVLAKAGTLHVGIYGKTETKTRPTLWAIGKAIKDGAEPCEATEEPTPDKWQQLLDELKRIAGADPEVIKPIIEDYISENPDEFRGEDGRDGANGKDGVDGEDGYTPVRGVDYYTPEDEAAIVQSVLAALPNGDEVSY